MPRGGSRPGAGRPRKGEERLKPEKIARDAAARDMTPLEFMLSVMNDANADEKLRAQMAVAAAPYIHAKPGDAPKGKKEQAQEEATEIASGGKFAPRRSPKLVVSNG